MRVPRLHVLVTPEVAHRDHFEREAASMRARCRSGLALHLRLPGLPGRDLFSLAERRVAERGAQGGWVVVNERLDVALGARADAVQLGRGALPARVAARVAGGRLAIGASVHDVETARRAARDGANFLVLGTIFATPSHPDVVPGGLARIAACADLGIPVVAIGGIDARRVSEVLGAGAAGVAVVRAVWGAEDPVRAAQELLDAMATVEDA